MPDVFCQRSEVVLWSLLNVQMFFQWICGGESGLPILFLHLRLGPKSCVLTLDIMLFISCYESLKIGTHTSHLSVTLPSSLLPILLTFTVNIYSTLFWFIIIITAVVEFWMNIFSYSNIHMLTITPLSMTLLCLDIFFLLSFMYFSFKNQTVTAFYKEKKKKSRPSSATLISHFSEQPFSIL